MASLLQLCSLFLTCLLICSASSNQTPKHYVVYMGSSSEENNEAAESDHLQLLTSVIPREDKERISLINHYNHAFRGFSAMLTEDEASDLSGRDGIVSVFPDSVLLLHTTRSWDFLEGKSSARFRHRSYQHKSSYDVIIGMIDGGIWPESPSFRDEGMEEIPTRWKGICMEGPDFKKSDCNRKLIGARYYNVPHTSNGKKTTQMRLVKSPRDTVWHGTHTASIAAGAQVVNASYNGLAQGTARGGSPYARIAVYKACSEDGCPGSTTLKAIDDAVKDGVDIISISIGMSSLFQSDFLKDPIAIGAFHAEQMGVMVVCSGGNEGPDPFTIINAAPWIFTVTASTIDRDFQSTVLLGNGRTFQGSAINFSNLTHSETYPLAYGKDIADKFSPISEARSCYPGSLDPEMVKGKVIVCVDTFPFVSREIKKLVAEDAQAKGLILINEMEKSAPFDSGAFPFTEVGSTIGYKILKYINSNKNPTATILPTADIPRHKPAPVVAYFSSRGPSVLTENILKPDIMAPGVAILAAVIPKVEEGSALIGNKPPEYAIKSGTSMACPHVTGASAFIKSVHPKWTSSMIKSALMTTATVYGNMGKPLTNSSGSFAIPHEMGVGEINPLKALNPGLVFETTTEDYLKFLCYNGSPEKKIRSMSMANFKCPRKSSDDLISGINYPSISISRLDKNGGFRTIKRSVTNVGLANVTYTVAVHAPLGLKVKVLPKKITFVENVRRVPFKVSFDGREASTGYNFGSLTWSGGPYSVRMVFAVKV
ncbi:CO(2)-response secreted protease-like [Durio zibethinus]|uniref:CO(2)-response secreted protease-like n=1 Tax=Durio zibethinus TaxID=66656 RepID=A0A6P6ASU6_DURZI|nr:CO(2)-response secreted protease-like [Durio zibethinus]XP_022767950.1 CO(2)-response secreted protease-like [Durio zibethinus]